MICSAKWVGGQLNSYVFLLEILLAKAQSVALVPADMESLYANLGECVVDVARFLGHYDMFTQPTFLWCSFGALAPKYVVTILSEAKGAAIPKGVKTCSGCTRLVGKHEVVE